MGVWEYGDKILNQFEIKDHPFGRRMVFTVTAL
jgi:hypothetical protein